jgi:hypothetical protein
MTKFENTPERLRTTAAIPLWCLVTRALLRDGSRSTWGLTLALLTTAFFFYVARSQIRWLNRSEEEWWNASCRADIAAFVSMVAPQRWFLPLLVFVGVFKATRATARMGEVSHGGSLWKTIPLVLLLHPRWSYTLDIAGVVALLAARHYPPSAQISDQREFHKEHEKRLGVDALGALVISSAGAPLTTRVALLAGTAVLFACAHLKYPRRDVSYFDAINQQPSHMPVPFRKVGAR